VPDETPLFDAPEEAYGFHVPYRIAAPPEPELPEPEEPYVAVLRRAHRRTRLVALAACAATVGIVVSALARPARTRPPPRDDAGLSAEAREAVRDARDRAHAEQARFETAMHEALARALVPRADLGACPVALESPSPLTHRAVFPLLTVEAHDTAALPSRAIADLLVDVQRAERHLDAGHYEEATLYARALRRTDRLRYDVVLVASTWTKPRATSASTYAPGEVDGRAYLYDFETGRVACAGDVHATSSPNVGYAYATAADAPPELGRHASLTATLEDDLRVAIASAVARAVRFRAGPPRS
jgi:hypothetical protein